MLDLAAQSEVQPILRQRDLVLYERIKQTIGTPGRVETGDEVLRRIVTDYALSGSQQNLVPAMAWQPVLYVEIKSVPPVANNAFVPV